MKLMKHPRLVSLGLVLAYHVLIAVSIWAPGWVIWLVGSWLFVPIAAFWMVPVCAWLHQKALDQIAFFRSALLWNLLFSLVKTVGLICLYRGAWFDALLWSGWVMFALASVLLAFLVFTWMESADPGARSRSTIVGEGIWQSILAALGVVLGFRLLWGGSMWLAYQGGVLLAVLFLLLLVVGTLLLFGWLVIRLHRPSFCAAALVFHTLAGIGIWIYSCASLQNVLPYLLNGVSNALLLGLMILTAGVMQLGTWIRQTFRFD